MPVKLSILIDVETSKVLSARVRVKRAHDMRDVHGLIRRVPDPPHVLLADKGYDSEPLHKWLDRSGIRAVVPVRKGCRHGRHRKALRDRFPDEEYAQRSIVESVFKRLKATVWQPRPRPHRPHRARRTLHQTHTPQHFSENQDIILHSLYIHNHFKVCSLFNPMARTLVSITWYLPSLAGGAERSLLQELQVYQRRGWRVRCLSFDEKYPEGTYALDGIEGYNYRLRLNLASISRYVTIYLNARYITRTIESNTEFSVKGHLVLTQTIAAPLVAEACHRRRIKYHYYIRDENNLSIFNNYEIGSRRVLKYIKTLLESPFRNWYSKRNAEALKHADKVITNSRFMHDLLKQKYGIESTIRHPPLNTTALKKITRRNPQFILFVGGGNAMKGYDIAEKIARAMPEEKFLFIGPYKHEHWTRNILRRPWTKDLQKVYGEAKLVIVPSRCNEAFCRVAAEASSKNIPVLSSSRGGLPESNKCPDGIIKAHEDIFVWEKKIREAIIERYLRN
ncbi:MAG: transposase [Nitrosarchaeum sp.]|nr:transposase [Nitrosarchaeum sp.]